MTTKSPGHDADAPQLSIARLPKERAAQQIVEQLGALIVRGELKHGDALPSERILAERFGCARGTVREAIHKLNDWGLLETKQGGTTRIGNAAEAFNIEVTELRYRLGPVDERERGEWIERRMLQGVSMVALAELHVDVEEVKRLEALIEPLAAIEDAAEAWTIEEQVWQSLAIMGQNRLFKRELDWWRRVMTGRAPPPSLMSAAMRVGFYRELLRRLRVNEGPATFYLQMVQMMLRSRQQTRRDET